MCDAADRMVVLPYMNEWSDWPCGARGAVQTGPLGGIAWPGVRECRVMSHPGAAASARTNSPTSDPHDRALVRQMLTLTPTERLLNVSAFWPLVRIGLQRRHGVSGACRS